MITRFAPSPTGPLHLGHAFSAMLASDLAKAEGGAFLLRIEDIDQSRARPEWEALIAEDLAWLGLTWPSPVMRQSDRLSAYRKCLQGLWSAGHVFACTCNRRDIEAAASAPQEGVPTHGPDGLIYPGTCRGNRVSPQQPTPPQDVALRLDMQAVARDIGFVETGAGPDGQSGNISISAAHLVQAVGDVVLSRRDMGTSYHLSVVLDDAAQGITHVVRGQDLFEATAIHALLQTVLGLPTPIYHHHRLIRDQAGKRLAKRDDARAIRLFRAEGVTPAEIRARLGL